MSGLLMKSLASFFTGISVTSILGAAHQLSLVGISITAKAQMSFQSRITLRKLLIIAIVPTNTVSAIDWIGCTAFVKKQISDNPDVMKNLTIYCPDSTQLNPLLTLAGCEVGTS
jgi:hypothetical protein